MIATSPGPCFKGGWLPSRRAKRQSRYQARPADPEVHSMLKSRLLEVLNYEPSTGVFTWRLGRNAGCVAGYTQSCGYLQIRIDGKAYYAHRLAWLAATGDLPKDRVDHIDGNRKNNRIENLRVVDQSTNLENQRQARADGSSGFLGVSKKRGRWRAAIKVKGKTMHIGTFDSPSEAQAAYIDFKRRMHVGCTI